MLFLRGMYLPGVKFPGLTPLQWARSSTLTAFGKGRSKNKSYFYAPGVSLDQTGTVFCVKRNLCNSPSFAIAMLDKKPFSRLPKTVQPLNYQLSIKTDLVKCVFEGRENIQLTVHEPVDKIQLNAADLQVEEATILCQGQTQVAQIQLDNDAGVLTLSLPSTLPVGEALLKLHFKGELGDKLRSFYRSKYKSSEGEERYLGVTQFEAADARRAFPCWDEPAVKATFDIALSVPKDRMAISNMPVESEKDMAEDAKYKTVTFLRTPKMSTYLVAWVVGEFDYVEEQSSDGIKVRVYTQLNKTEQGLFALHVASKVLPYYKDYFGIGYPLPKMDLIAIPDFACGAMENWGMVTYRETCLLVDPANTSASNRQWVALVVGHELAHQWFGNLVTMEWWTDLWLNEGYASFVEHLCVEHLFPDYQIWNQFVTDTFIPALELDSLKTSHAIEVPVGPPEEVDEIFDAISYNKGASVIRMLHNYIGDEDFRKGMHLYLTRHQYDNTVTVDLWKALAEASGKAIQQIMEGWTLQMGFPLISVEETMESGNRRVLSLNQTRFLADGSTDETKWMVPVQICSGQDPKRILKDVLLEQTSAEVVLENVAETDWVKLNPSHIGFFRTRYPSAMLQRFIPAITDLSMPPIDRLGIMDDLFALAQAGQSSTVEVLRLMEAYKAETEFPVWSTLTAVMGKLNTLLEYTPHQDQFKAFARLLLGKVVSELGWDAAENEGHLTTMLRSLTVGRLTSLDDPNMVAEAQRRFQAHISGERILVPDIRPAVYRAVLRHGDKATLEQFLKLYRDASMHEEKDRILRAVGAIRDPEVLKEVIQFAVTEARTSETITTFLSVSCSRLGRDMVWDYLKENWDFIVERYQGMFLLARLLKSLIEEFASEEKALEVEAFFRDHQHPGTERAIQQGVESIRLNAAWLKRDAEIIGQFLSQK